MISAIDSNNFYLIFFLIIHFSNRKITYIKLELFSGTCVCLRNFHIYIFLHFYIHVSAKFLRCKILTWAIRFSDVVSRTRVHIPAFCLDVAMPSIRAVSNVRYGGERKRRTGWRRTRQKEGGSEKEKHLTLCLAGCRTQLISMLRQQIPTHRTLINAPGNVLVTWSMRSRPFPSLHPPVSFSLFLFSICFSL